MIREALEDYTRYKSDIELNRSDCKLFRKGVIETAQWSEVMVGDICYVEENEVFPADLIVINSALSGG